MLERQQALAHARTAPDLAAGQEAVDKTPRARRRTDVALSVSYDLGAVEAEWRNLEKTGDCTVFQSFDWLAAWQRHIGRHTRTTPVLVLGRGASDRLLFILPLAVSRLGPVRQLTYLGRELGDYNAPLLAADFPASYPLHAFGELWDEVRAHLQANRRSRHDLVLLDKMPERVGNQPNPFLQLSVSRNPSGAYLTVLSAPDWDAFYAAKRSPSTRRRDRTKRKRLAENGEIRIVTAQEPGDIAETLGTLIAQKRRAFARMGVSDIFARRDQRDFYLDIATNLRTRNLAHVSRLEVGTAVAAVNLGLEFRGGYYHVLASYDDGPLSRFGPGAAHLHELMSRAIARGCRVFDFTIGDEPYKRDWCDTELALFDHLAAATARGWAVVKVVAALRAAKRGIKQSSLLWPMVLRGRAALASLKRRTPAQGEDASERDPS